MNNSDAYRQHMTTEFDPQFESASQVTAFPWVGKNYHQSEILILGHTAHDKKLKAGSSKPLGRDDNRDIAAWYWGHPNTAPFPVNRTMIGMQHRHTCNMFLDGIGKPYNRENQIAFWESVAFTNYCQSAVPKIDRNAPCPCDEKSKQATTQAIAILKPKLVIAWTTVLSKFHFPVNKSYNTINRGKPRIAFATEQMPAIIGIKHPARAFSPPVWYEFLAKNSVTKPHIAKLVQHLKDVLRK